MGPEKRMRVLTEYDLHLIGEGSHYKKYEKLGSHIREIEGMKGIHFVVWAPNAEAVSVIGDFNGWDSGPHPMQSLGDSGIWEIFIPGLGEGTLYKFEIRSRFSGYVTQKADPFGFYFEVRPKSASIVYDIEGFGWNDSHWMAKRAERNWLESPVAIY